MALSTDLRLIQRMLAQPLTDAEREALRWRLGGLIVTAEEMQREAEERLIAAIWHDAAYRNGRRVRHLSVVGGEV